jgi:hypothetical protein
VHVMSPMLVSMMAFGRAGASAAIAHTAKVITMSTAKLFFMNPPDSVLIPIPELLIFF